MGKRIRTEVYIDRRDASENKGLFDALFKSKEAIEGELEEPLEWERLDEKKASRIAIYREGSIEDDAQTLAEIREWTIGLLLRFKEVFGQKIPELVK